MLTTGIVALLTLTGCLEQLQTTRSAPSALSNFLIHLRAGELDDARTYFAPGLVQPSQALDNSIIEASTRLRGYEIDKGKGTEASLGNGEKIVTIPGRVRKLVAPGKPTPGPEEGWQQTDIISATMVERGPGWRILDFQLLCCTEQK